MGDIDKSLRKDCTADDRKRILQFKTEKNETFEKYKEPYYAEITMPSAETFFSSKIVGKNKNSNHAIGRSDSSLDGLSIGNVLRYLNLPESDYCKLFILNQKPTREGELAEAVKSVLANPKGRTGWIAVFEHSVIKETGAQALIALNNDTGVQRYIIPCGDRCLLFVNKAMYNL